MLKLSSEQIPQLAEWPKGGKPGMTLKLKMIAFTKITSGASVTADGEFEVVEVEDHV